MANKILNTKLSNEDQNEILSELLNFSSREGIVFDQDGDEFFAPPSNKETDLSTLKGIINLIRSQERFNGRRELQGQINALLNF